MDNKDGLEDLEDRIHRIELLLVGVSSQIIESGLYEEVKNVIEKYREESEEELMKSFFNKKKENF